MFLVAAPFGLIARHHFVCQSPAFCWELRSRPPPFLCVDFDPHLPQVCLSLGGMKIFSFFDFEHDLQKNEPKKGNSVPRIIFDFMFSFL